MQGQSSKPDGADAKGARTTPRERLVGLLPEDMAEAEPEAEPEPAESADQLARGMLTSPHFPFIVTDLAEFAKGRRQRMAQRKKAADDERIGADVPECLKGMLEHLAIAASSVGNPPKRRGRSRRAISIDCVGEYCMWLGLSRIEEQAGVRAVIEASDSFVELGSKEREWFNRTFLWTPTGQRGRLFVRVPGLLHQRYVGIGDGLGWSDHRSKVVALALALALLDAPLTDTDNAYLADLVESFARAVRERAEEVKHRLRSITPPPAPLRPRTDYQALLTAMRGKAK